MSRNNRKWHPLPFSLVDLCGDVVVPTIKIKRLRRHSGRLCNREISAKLRTPIVTSDGSFISFNALTAPMANHDWENEYIWIRESLSFYNGYRHSIMPKVIISLCKTCIVSSKKKIIKIKELRQIFAWKISKSKKFAVNRCTVNYINV